MEVQRPPRPAPVALFSHPVRPPEAEDRAGLLPVDGAQSA